MEYHSFYIQEHICFWQVLKGRDKNWLNQCVCVCVWKVPLFFFRHIGKFSFLVSLQTAEIYFSLYLFSHFPLSLVPAVQQITPNQTDLIMLMDFMKRSRIGGLCSIGSGVSAWSWNHQRLLYSNLWCLSWDTWQIKTADWSAYSWLGLPYNVGPQSSQSSYMMAQGSKHKDWITFSGPTLEVTDYHLCILYHSKES